MALTRFDTTLEYSPQVLEFIVYDEFGVPKNLGSSSALFTVNRIDGTGTYSTSVSIESIVEDGTITNNAHINVTTDMSTYTQYYNSVHKDGDADYSFDDPVWEHTYSIVVGNNTIIAGRLNMVKV